MLLIGEITAETYLFEHDGKPVFGSLLWSIWTNTGHV
jgi:hypothetical protein